MTKKKSSWIAGLLAMVVAGGALAEGLPENWDGLVQIEPRKMDAAYLLPGADFRGYTKILLDPAEVAFRKDWLRDANRSSAGPAARISDEEADEILAAARSNFDDVFVAAFSQAGYQLAEAPGPDVLRVSTAVIDLDVRAPLPDQGFHSSTTFVVTAGQAILVVELRDSRSGALLGRAVDASETRRRSSPVTPTSNLKDFRAMFEAWAVTATKGIAELQAHSPVPEDLKPKARL